MLNCKSVKKCSTSLILLKAATTKIKINKADVTNTTGLAFTPKILSKKLGSLDFKGLDFRFFAQKFFVKGDMVFVIGF